MNEPHTVSEVYVVPEDRRTLSARLRGFGILASVVGLGLVVGHPHWGWVFIMGGLCAVFLGLFNLPGKQSNSRSRLLLFGAIGSGGTATIVFLEAAIRKVVAFASNLRY
jgi:hypothetical protein